MQPLTIHMILSPALGEAVDKIREHFSNNKKGRKQVIRQTLMVMCLLSLVAVISSCNRSEAGIIYKTNIFHLLSSAEMHEETVVVSGYLSKDKMFNDEVHLFPYEDDSNLDIGFRSIKLASLPASIDISQCLDKYVTLQAVFIYDESNLNREFIKITRLAAATGDYDKNIQRVVCFPLN